MTCHDKNYLGHHFFYFAVVEPRVNFLKKDMNDIKTIILDFNLSLSCIQIFDTLNIQHNANI